MTGMNETSRTAQDITKQPIQIHDNSIEQRSQVKNDANFSANISQLNFTDLSQPPSQVKQETTQQQQDMSKLLRATETQPNVQQNFDAFETSKDELIADGDKQATDALLSDRDNVPDQFARDRPLIHLRDQSPIQTKWPSAVEKESKFEKSVEESPAFKMSHNHYDESMS